jgi:hypothetical protein
MTDLSAPIPIYTTSGDVGGFFIDPYIYNRQGDWIGWVTPDRLVYSVHGRYTGWLSKDWRILRKRAYDYHRSSRTPPKPPPHLRPPAHSPLPPLMAEISISIIDVLDERPELLPTIDSFAFTDDVG